MDSAREYGGSSISAVHFERTAHRVPLGGVSADQRRCVVRGGVEPPTFRFSGQPRQALCRPAKTDVTDKRNRARRKVQAHASRVPRTLLARSKVETGPFPTRRFGACRRRPRPECASPTTVRSLMNLADASVTATSAGLSDAGQAASGRTHHTGSVHLQQRVHIRPQANGDHLQLQERRCPGRVILERRHDVGKGFRWLEKSNWRRR